MNINGKPIDKCGPIKGVKLSPIHADPPMFIDHELTTAEVLETSIKVIDLLWTLGSYSCSGKTSLFGGAGVGNAKAHGGFSIFSRGEHLGLVTNLEGNSKAALGFWSLNKSISPHGLTTTAKYFHHEEGQHAGSKVAAVLGHIPSAVGYQTHTSMDMGGMYG
ncbi:hypothetical protein EV401DRAFT_2055895 [Pisolithus croceorrhizus]|nr:hypothetical protein EV401DRAFT_2055895 [Pisolithus croceorrhizus]